MICTICGKEIRHMHKEMVEHLKEKHKKRYDKLMKLKAKKTTTYKEMMDELYESFELEVETERLWKVI